MTTYRDLQKEADHESRLRVFSTDRRSGQWVVETIQGQGVGGGPRPIDDFSIYMGDRLKMVEGTHRTVASRARRLRQAQGALLLLALLCFLTGLAFVLAAYLMPMPRIDTVTEDFELLVWTQDEQGGLIPMGERIK